MTAFTSNELATALVVFREVLEAALVVSVVLAATRGIRARGRWVFSGVTVGIGFAALLAIMAQQISGMIEGTGQEILNSFILFVVVALLGWHVVWMSAHGREMSARLKVVGREVSDGAKHLSVLAIIVCLAVMREGTEVILILHGLAVSSGGEVATVLSIVPGVIAGGAAGFVMYAGFRFIPISKLFAITNWILMLIAAGMAARGINYLAAAGYVPDMGAQIWDTSTILPERGGIGQVLATLIGYMERPSGVQVLAYVVTVAVFTAGMKLADRASKIAKTVAVLLVGLVGVTGLADRAAAGVVLSPRFQAHEVELEYAGDYEFDSQAVKSGERDHEFAVGYGITPYWKSELEAEYEGGADAALEHVATMWNNTFALTQTGEYFVDPALFLGFSLGHGEPDAITPGLLLSNDMGRFTNTLNLLVKKEIASHAGTGASFKYAFQTRYRYKSWLQPGIELYGDTKTANRFEDQRLDIGPAVFGKIPGLLPAHGLNYQAGVLFGATRQSSDVIMKWRLEYEFAL